VNPATTLVITFGVLTLALLAFFWAATNFFQGQLYETIAEKVVVRAAIAALLVSGFVCAWVYINTRAESRDRYGTLFEFSPTASVSYPEFLATRRTANKREYTVAYKKSASRFVDVNEPTKSFQLTTSDYLVTAIEVTMKDERVRFDAELDANGKYSDRSPRVFRERGGRRYLEIGGTNVPSPIQIPNRRAMVLAIGINGLHFLVWLIACWPVLKYELGHSILASLALGFLFMLIVMPLLFQKNKVTIPFHTPRPAAPA
jgi:hypothetical protein